MFYTSQLMAKHGIQAVFSDRQGGVSQSEFHSLNLGFDLNDEQSHVEQNLNMFCQKSGLPIPHQAKQVHKTNVLLCSGVGFLHKEEADILISKGKGVAVAVRTADCLPIVLADKGAGIVAAVHAGWRGSVEQVVQCAVQTMLSHGAKLECILVSLGPCIGECCFEVSENIGKQLSVSCGQNVTVRKKRKVYADLVKVNMQQLINIGLSIENIELSGHCTCCSDSPKYFSYRRDSGQTGRQLSMISFS